MSGEESAPLIDGPAGELDEEVGRRQTRTAVELAGDGTLVAVGAIDHPVRLLLGAADPIGDTREVVLVGRGLDGEFVAKRELSLQKL